jgi:hypothetical protein
MSRRSLLRGCYALPPCSRSRAQGLSLRHLALAFPSSPYPLSASLCFARRPPRVLSCPTPLSSQRCMLAFALSSTTTPACSCAATVASRSQAPPRFPLPPSSAVSTITLKAHRDQPGGVHRGAFPLTFPCHRVTYIMKHQPASPLPRYACRNKCIAVRAPPWPPAPSPSFSSSSSLLFPLYLALSVS